VELALVLPFLTLMFALAVDFGRVYYTTQVLQTAAATGVASASGTTWVPTTSGTPAQAAQTAACAEGASLNPPLGTNQVAVAFSGNLVTVTVNYNFPLLTGFLVQGGTVPLQTSVTASVAPEPGN
jgi:Flp pilus assembly protein TadG